MKLLIVFAVLLVTGCSHDKGECVWVSANSWSQAMPIKAEYIKFDGGSHWYVVDGELRSMLGVAASVTSCD